MDLQQINLQHLHLLLLIIVANGGPIVISQLFGQHFRQPVDFKHTLPDGFPIFGQSKTWRGLAGSLIFTSTFAYLLSYSALIGTYIALAAMSGDLISSFIKRRLKIASSSPVPLLDGVLECLFPLTIMVDTFSLQWSSFTLICLVFVIIELSLSKLRHKLHL